MVKSLGKNSVAFIEARALARVSQSNKFCQDTKVFHSRVQFYPGNAFINGFEVDETIVDHIATVAPSIGAETRSDLSSVADLPAMKTLWYGPMMFWGYEAIHLKKPADRDIILSCNVIKIEF